MGIPTATTIDETATDEIEGTEEPGEDTEDTEETEKLEGEDADGDGFALEQPYSVPSDSAFQGKELISNPPDLVLMMHDLIFECSPDFDHLQAAPIDIGWKRKGGMANGGVQRSGHLRTGWHAASRGAKEFLLWIAADLSRESLTKKDIEELVYHEMCHLTFNENSGEVKIRDEPVKFFPSQRRRYPESKLMPKVPVEGEGEEDADGPLLRALEGMEMGDEEAPSEEGGDEEHEDLPVLAQHLDAQPEQIEPVPAAADDAPVAETAKRARGRRAASTTARGAVGIAG